MLAHRVGWLKMADKLLRGASPAWRARRKYDGELRWWQNELKELKRWYDGECEWYCIPPPSPEQIQLVSPVWTTNAVRTLHHMAPYYPEALHIAGDEFAGKRVLEVGCGPLAPIMQFRECALHGLDPLADLYLRCGWPLYDYGVTIVNARGESMPYVDSYFDAVISVNALDHVDDFAQVASEVQRVVKVGGRLYFEIEYHEPRPLEPQRINDELVLSSFERCEMHKICERSSELAERLGLLPGGVDPHEEIERLAVWHGQRVR